MKDEKIEESDLIEDELDFWSTPTLKEEQEQEDEEQEDILINAPCFPDEIYQNLPPILYDILKDQKGRNRDMIFLTMMSLLSYIIPNVSVNHYNKIHKPNLMCFISAPSGSNKSIVLEVERQLFEKRKQNEEEKELDFKIQNPKLKFFDSIIDSNTSKADAINKLDFNKGRCYVLQPEIRDMLENKKQSWGDLTGIYSDSWDHSSIRKSRVGEDDVKIKNLQISLLQTGFIPSLLEIFVDRGTADGFFSRCLYYMFDVKDKPVNIWLDENIPTPIKLTHKLKTDVWDLENFFKSGHYTVEFSRKQKLDAGDFMMNKAIHYSMTKENFKSINNRFNVAAKRILTIFSAIRYFYMPSKPTLVENNIINVSNKDIEITKMIMDVLYEHISLLYDNVDKKADKTEIKKDDKIEKFYKKLPNEFNQTAANIIGDQTNLCKSKTTVKKWLNKFIEAGKLTRDTNKQYKKTK